MGGVSGDAARPMLTEDEAFEHVAQGIVEAVSQGQDGQWRMPWNAVTGGRPCNAMSGKLYRGQNVIILWSAARINGFASPQWASRAAWRERGAVVPEDAVGTIIVAPLIDPESKPTKWTRATPGIRARMGPLGGAAEGGEFRKIKGWTKTEVFNVHQVKGVTITERVKPAASVAAEALVQAHSRWRARGGPTLLHGGLAAFWRADVDRINLPEKASFPDFDGLSGLEYYAATLAHECVHAAGARARLDRWSLHDYHKKVEVRAQEELVAEIGSAFLCSHFGLATVLRPDHNRYVGGWLRRIRDPKQRGSLLWAIREAERSAHFIVEASGAFV